MKRGTPRHPKVFDLMEDLKISRPEALGYLELLWHFAAEMAPRGDIGRYSDARIEAALDWTGRGKKAGALIAGLIRCRWLEVHVEYRVVIHDWADHCEDSVRKKLARAGQSFVSDTGKVAGQIPDNVAPPSGQSSPGYSPDVRLARGTGVGEGLGTGQGVGAGGSALALEWPQVARAIRQYFPASDDRLVLAVVHEAVREFVDVLPDGTGIELTDEVIAKAVHQSYFQKQESAGAFKQRVPRCIRTWAEDAKQHRQVS